MSDDAWRENHALICWDVTGCNVNLDECTKHARINYYILFHVHFISAYPNWWNKTNKQQQQPITVIIQVNLH